MTVVIEEAGKFNLPATLFDTLATGTWFIYDNHLLAQKVKIIGVPSVNAIAQKSFVNERIEMGTELINLEGRMVEPVNVVTTWSRE